MAIQKLYTSLSKSARSATYVGEKGRIWYDTTTGFRISNGVTPGGQAATVAVTNANIGNLVITGTTISALNTNEDLNLSTNGTGNVKIVGELFVTQTDGTRLIDSLTNGTMNFYVPVQNTTDSGIDIIGTPNRDVVAPQNVGVMLHVTGQPSLPSRLYNDGANAYAFYGGRRYNGTASSPTGVQSNTLVTRYGSTPYHSTGWPTVSTARIEMYTTEDQTSSNQGSNIALWTTPIGSGTIAQVASFDDRALTVTGNVVAGNVSGTKATFTTVDATLSASTQAAITAVGTLGSLAVTGNVTGGNVITGGSVSDSVGLLRSIPQNSKNTGYTLQATDNGQMINITTGNVTVPASVFNSPYGQTVSIYNNQTTSNAVVQGSGVTLRLAGTTATGNRTLSRYGVATLICVAANTFVISGAGLS